MKKFSKKFISKSLKILDRILTLFLLLVIFNLNMPQLAFAQNGSHNTINIPTTVQLPYNAGKTEYFYTYQPKAHLPINNDLRETQFEIMATITGYTSDPYQTDDTPCITASGLNVCARARLGRQDTIATNFKYLPFGTRLKIPELYGEKIFIVDDRMNTRYNGKAHFDIWMGEGLEDKYEAIQFGVKYSKILIY